MQSDAQKSPEELYAERIQRVKDVIALRVPDRVPVFGPYQKFPYTYAGVTMKAAMNDYGVARSACHKFAGDFQPDLDFGPGMASPARVMETLGWKAFRWPGHGVADDLMYQYVEGEFMSADEYDEFISDPSDFMMRKWTPRQFSALEGFGQTVPWRRFMWTGWMNMGFFASPEMREALKLAIQAGEELNAWTASLAQYGAEAKAAGFPLASASNDWPPFDILGDTLRGTRGVLLDMRRNPDKLLRAMEVTTKIFIEYGESAAGAELPLCWIWMHKGASNFMSDQQFTTFYWPFLRQGMLALIEKGITPVVYCEADVETRLEHFADMPKGKIIYHVSHTNLAKAKAVQGGTACIMGNVPNSLMASGTPEEVRAYCKQSIDAAGKDGGYIMDTAVMLDEARPENLKAMIDFTKEYGIYA